MDKITICRYAQSAYDRGYGSVIDGPRRATEWYCNCEDCAMAYEEGVEDAIYEMDESEGADGATEND